MKKWLCIAVAMRLMVSAVCAVPVSADDLGENIVYASVNGVLRYGDVNNDGRVDSTDARLILQRSVGKFTHFSEAF